MKPATERALRLIERSIGACVLCGDPCPVSYRTSPRVHRSCWEWEKT